MSTLEQDADALKQEGEKREAGVAELMELYGKVKPFYAEAARRSRPAYKTFASDSTNPERIFGKRSVGE